MSATSPRLRSFRAVPFRSCLTAHHITFTVYFNVQGLTNAILHFYFFSGHYVISKLNPLWENFPCSNFLQLYEAALAELEEGKWMKTPDFFNYLVATGHGFDVARNDWRLNCLDKGICPNPCTRFSTMSW